MTTAQPASSSTDDAVPVPPLDSEQVISTRLLALIFLGSGLAALLYQLAWQRRLMVLFGTDIESITVVVTAFMAGLGLGSLAGGRVSRRSDRRLTLWFAGIEAAIGVYGLASLPLMDAVAARAVAPGHLTTGLIALGLVLVPTLLMGATLPLLVAWLVRQRPDVGRAVGLLYCVNTLGAALGALLAVSLVLGSLGLAGTVRLAAAINLTCALSVALAGRGRS